MNPKDSDPPSLRDKVKRGSPWAIAAVSTGYAGIVTSGAITIERAEAFAKFLERSGPYAVSTVCLVAVLFLFRALQAAHERRIKDVFASYHDFERFCSAQVSSNMTLETNNESQFVSLTRDHQDAKEQADAGEQRVTAHLVELRDLVHSSASVTHRKIDGLRAPNPGSGGQR